MTTFFTKDTPSGAFTVVIEAHAPATPTLLLNTDVATRFKELADVLTEAATSAMQCAVGILEPVNAAGVQ